MIAKDTENKEIGWQIESGVSHNSGISAADCVPILQEIKQGVDNQQRLGDKVRPKRLRVSGTIALEYNDFTSSQNLYARVIIASQKTIKVGSVVAAAGVSTGALVYPAFAGAPSGPFLGGTNQLDHPVNRELFKVYMDKVVKLCPVFETTPSTSTSPTPLTCFRWSYTFKSMPASFQWDDTNGDWANNFAPFLAIGYAYADNSSPDIIATKLISNCYSVLSYEDA